MNYGGIKKIFLIKHFAVSNKQNNLRPSPDPERERFPERSGYSWVRNNFPNRIDPDGRIDMWGEHFGARGTRTQRNQALSTSPADFQARERGVTREDKIITYGTVGTMATITAVAGMAILAEGIAGASKIEPASPQPDDVNKRPGSRGHPDHQRRVEDTAEQARRENPNKRVVTERKINHEESNRRPDVQVVNPETNRTERVYEVERNPNSRRNQEREAEYRRLGIPFETIPL